MSSIGDNGGKDDEDGEKEEKPMGSDEEGDEDQLGQADFGSTPPVQVSRESRWMSSRYT